MRGPLDLSIGQRLGAGFGLLVLMLITLILTIRGWHQRSADAQTEFSERIAPLVQQTATVERAVFRVVLSMRAWLLHPAAEELESYHEAVSHAERAVQELGELPMPGESRTAYERTDSLIRAYLRVTKGVVADNRTDRADTNREAAIRVTREAALSSIAAYAAIQDGRANVELAEMAAARGKVSRGIISASILATLVIVILGIFTTQSIRGPTRELLQVAQALETGNWEPALELARELHGSGSRNRSARSEMRRLARAFGAAAVALQRRQQQLGADRMVANATASSLDKQVLCKLALRAIVEHVRAEVGVVYWHDVAAGQLQPVAQQALDGELPMMRVGEGIPGQAADEHRTVTVRDIPKDSPFAIKFGYDRAPPRTVAAVPILCRDTLHGVLLVASLHDLDDDALSFLGSAAIQLGIGLENVGSHEEIQALLANLRDTHQQIQANNEELQAQNEEIQAQTEQLQLQQEELQAQNEELEQQSHTLRMHVDLLARADEKKDEFLGILAHELRNPMAPITNSLFLLKHAAPGSEQAVRAQEVMERQTRHMIRLIDDLLDITRISEGKIHIQKVRVDLREIVRTCIEDYDVALTRGELNVKLDTLETPALVDGDHTRLCQIVGNLLSNAIKFTNPGGSITIALRLDLQMDQVVVEVEDTGLGIPESLQPQLFHPFTQGSTTLARSNGGLGLGLALVKALVELHQGSVTAASDGPGQGARFTVRLPRQSPGAVLESPPPTPVSRQWRILLIEDNIDAARSLSEALSLQGHELAVAHSGAAGLDRARRFRPELIVCDIGLPDMDGYELARRVRADPELRSVFLVALTGYAAEADQNLAAQAGFDHHLAKPSGPEQITEILSALHAGRARS